MQYTPEKTEDILKYYESLKPANLSVSNNNSNNSLKRTLDRK